MAKIADGLLVLPMHADLADQELDDIVEAAHKVAGT